MLDGLSLNLGDMSAIALLVIVMFMVLTGRLTPRREVDAEKERADSWEAAWKAAMEANRERDIQNAELLANSRTTVRILEAIQEQARDAGKGSS